MHQGGTYRLSHRLGDIRVLTMHVLHLKEMVLE